MSTQHEKEDVEKGADFVRAEHSLKSVPPGLSAEADSSTLKSVRHIGSSELALFGDAELFIPGRFGATAIAGNHHIDQIRLAVARRVGAAIDGGLEVGPPSAPDPGL
jgi:hypothetical protein